MDFRRNCDQQRRPKTEFAVLRWILDPSFSSFFEGDFDGLRVFSCLRGAPVPMREKILPHGMMDATLPSTVVWVRK